MFRYFPFWLVIFLLLGSAATVPLLNHFGLVIVHYREVSISLCARFGVLVILYYFGKQRAAPAAAILAGDLARARRHHDVAFEKAELRHQREQERIKNEFENTNRDLDQE